MSGRPPRNIDPDQLTGPERAAERAQGKRSVAKVKACGGCYCCLNRDRTTEGWGVAVCRPEIGAEFQRTGCQFEPDYDRIYDRGNIE